MAVATKTATGSIAVLGRLWLPNRLAATEMHLSGYDVENLRNSTDDGKLTKSDIERWLGSHAGDYSEIVDFAARIGTAEYGWSDEDNEIAWLNYMFPESD